MITALDMDNTIKIIDACVERGAFKGNEIMIVAKVRQSLHDHMKELEQLAEKTEALATKAADAIVSPRKVLGGTKPTA